MRTFRPAHHLLSTRVVAGFVRSLAAAASIAMVASLLPAPAAAGAVGDFAAEVLKKVAVDVIASVIKDAIKPGAPAGAAAQPAVVAGSVDDKARVRNVVAALTDTMSPLAERIGLYATRVDYFGAGVVDQRFILKDRERFEARWPIRRYTIRSIDEIAVAPDGTYAIARYTVDYQVERAGDARKGVTRVAVVIGSFHVQPRIHAIKEWVTRAV